jgi:hypothetical protein
MASYVVNDHAVARARKLIGARQYVLDSEWGEVQPSADDENAYLSSHSWEEYAEWHLGLTEGASDETKVEGELTLQLGDELSTAGPGALAFAPRGIPHTLANHGSVPARFLVVCTPAGFEREFARRAAARAGVEPPSWALHPIPEVTRVGPRIGEPSFEPIERRARCD